MEQAESFEPPKPKPRGRPPTYTPEQREAAKAASRRLYRKRIAAEKKLRTPEEYAALEAKPVGRPPKRTAAELKAGIVQARVTYRDRLASEIASAAKLSEEVRGKLETVTRAIARRLERAAKALDEAAAGGNAKAMREAVRLQVASVREASAELSSKVTELAARNALEEGEVMARLVRYARRG